MKWKREPCKFLSEKTFLIIKDDLSILKGKVLVVILSREFIDINPRTRIYFCSKQF